MVSREAFEAYMEKAGGWPNPQDLWQAAQADAFERAAKVCEAHYAGPISAVIFEHEHETAQLLAWVIRALAKESGNG